MKYKANWEETKEKFTNYWCQKNTGRPLMCVIARKPEIEHLSDGKPVDGGFLGQICQGAYYGLPDELKWQDMEDKYQNAERMLARYRHFCETHEFLGESFPNLDVDFGPGSLAVYLGSDIVFEEQTVWFKEFLDSWENYPELKFNPDNEWFQKHLQLVKDCRR